MIDVGAIVCLLAARLAVRTIVGGGRGGRVGDHDSMLRQRKLGFDESLRLRLSQLVVCN